MSTVSSKDTIEDLDLDDEFYVIKKDGNTRTSHKVDGKAMAALFRPKYRIILFDGIDENLGAGNHKLAVNIAGSQNMAPVTLNDDRTVITLPAGKLYKLTYISEQPAEEPILIFRLTSNPVGGAVRSVEDWENTPLLYYTANFKGLVHNFIDLTDTETNEEVCALIVNPLAQDIDLDNTTLIIEEYS